MANLYTPEELLAVIARAEALLGDSLDGLVQSYQLGAASPTPPRHQHRLVEQLLRLRRSAENPDDALAANVAAVTIVEVSSVLDTMEPWQGDACWPEFQSALKDPRSYLHTVTTLAVATSLRQKHPQTELVASSTPGRSPDLRMVVSDEHELAVEVKTSLELAGRSKAMPESEALKFIEGAIHGASTGFKGQLKACRPGVLVVGGFQIDTDTFTALGNAAGHVLRSRRQRTHLLAIIVARFVLPSPWIEDGRAAILMGHQTRIRTNPWYAGTLRFVGDWAGEWHLEAAPPKP